MQRTLKQYRTADLLILTLLMCGLETLSIVLLRTWAPFGLFASMFFPVVLIIIMRWDHYGILPALIHGIVYSICFGAALPEYVIFTIGNLGIMSVLLLFKLIGKDKIAKKWYLTIVYLLVAYISVELCRTLIALCFGYGFLLCMSITFFADAFSLILTSVILLVARKQNGLFEDQLTYLRRQESERLAKAAKKPNY